jgi:hypothetical protein
MEYRINGFLPATPPLHSPLPELLQKPQIVLEKEPDIVNTIFKHRNPLHAHAKREAGNFLGIITNKTENLWINHARAKDFQPPCRFANPTDVSTCESAAAAADQTLDIDLPFRSEKAIS